MQDKYMEHTQYQAGMAYANQGTGKRLIIMDGLSQIREIGLETLHKTRIYIGKDPSNDIVLGSPFVSHQHGKLKLDGSHLLYADTNNTNGTIVDSDGYRRLLKSNRQYYIMKNGDMLRVEPDKPDPEHSVLILYESGETEGSWRRFPLMAPCTRIGREEKNDIHLPSPSVSRYHAEILHENGKYRIVDKESSNGIFLNGTKLTGSSILREKDVIGIANHTLVFTNGLIFYKSTAQGINIEAQSLFKYAGRDKKKILDDVSCTIESNEFVAIVGGSGAGKTTLMNALSCFDKRFEGQVLYNGIDLKKNFAACKSLIGYVPQEDIIYENLTLKRMLLYTAKLKMPKDTSKEEMQERIRQVLEMVELQDHQDTYIRKLSGGQKKRASIAVELLADPSVFFLDEPTSGLDPGTEQKLMVTLSRLSKSQGKTIIMVTHTTQSLHLCDKVIFMGRGGRLCFAGSTDQAKMYFDTEDLVDIYNTTTENPGPWADQYRNIFREDQSNPTGLSAKPARTMPNQEKKEGKKGRKERFPLRQLPILSARYLELIKNDWQRLALLVLQPAVIALLLSIVAGEKVFSQYEDTKSILFALTCAGMWIGLFNSIQEICKERVILRREYMGGLKLSLYTGSKFLVQTLVALLQAAMMLAIFTGMEGGPEQGILTGNALPEMFLTLWLTIEASMALGFVISSLVKNTDRAMTLAPFVLILQLLFSGILFELKGVGSKIGYATISKWSVEAFGSTANLNDLPRRLEEEIPTMTHEAEEIFEATKSHLYTNWGILAGIVLVCAILCAILLRRISKDGR